MTTARSGDPHLLGPGLLPTPFTADDIRVGCPDGRRIRMQVEEGGRVVAFRENTFRDGDADGAIIESTRFAADGTPEGPPEAGRSTWRELQEHASFEAARTTIVPERLDTPTGWLDCLRYTVREDDGSIEDFWFARSAPGMPIRYRTTVDGRVTREVTVIENVLPPR